MLLEPPQQPTTVACSRSSSWGAVEAGCFQQYKPVKVGWSVILLLLLLLLLYREATVAYSKLISLISRLVSWVLRRRSNSCLSDSSSNRYNSPCRPTYSNRHTFTRHSYPNQLLYYNNNQLHSICKKLSDSSKQNSSCSSSSRFKFKFFRIPPGGRRILLLATSSNQPWKSFLL